VISGGGSVASSEKVRGRVIDAHSHIGTMQAW